MVPMFLMALPLYAVRCTLEGLGIPFSCRSASYGYICLKDLSVKMFPFAPVSTLTDISILLLLCCEALIKKLVENCICLLYFLAPQTGQKFPTAAVTYFAVPNVKHICLVVFEQTPKI